MMRWVLGATLSLMLTTSAQAAHRPGLAWMQGMSGNGLCCSTYDCTEATVVVLGHGLTQTIVLIGDVELTVPSHWVHPSQDGHGYWCFRATSTTPTYTGPDGIKRAVPPAVPTRENSRCFFYQSTG